MHAVRHSARPSLLVFGASWCQPCHRLHALLDELAPAYPGLEIIDIDIESEPRLAERYQVRSVPTMIAVRDGAVIASQVGIGRRSAITDLLDALA